jgi:2-oxoglutarate ferredoxin oxidoreductase subunit gamma
MERSYFLAGTGGQGVQTIGTLLIYTMNQEGKFATYLPEYEGTQRGGASNCTVVVSDGEIGAFVARYYDNMVLLDANSYKRFKDWVKPGGTLFVNSSLIEDIEDNPDIRVVRLPLYDMANEIGSSLVLNVILFGLLARYTGDIPIDIAKKIMLEKMGKKKQFVEINVRAFDFGVKKAEDLIAAI